MPFIDRIRPQHSGFLTLSLLAYLAALPLGGGILYWVAQNSGPRTGTVIVHVTVPDVVVTVGGKTFRDPEFTCDPFVCELPAGEHQLMMKRGEEVMHDETFILKAGEERVLTAWWSRGNALP